MNEEELIREFKSIGVVAGTKYRWQQLALDVCEEFHVEKPNIRKWIFGLCRQKPYTEVEEKFSKSKEKGLRYFLASFRNKTL